MNVIGLKDNDDYGLATISWSTTLKKIGGNPTVKMLLIDTNGAWYVLSKLKLDSESY